MPVVKTPKSPAAGDYDNEFITKEVTLRGRKYVMRELTVAKYDELVRLATSKNAEGEDLIDNGLLRKLMASASLVEPKTKDLQSLGLRLASKLISVAQEINYGTEPEEGEEKEPDIQEGDPEEEGEG